MKKFNLFLLFVIFSSCSVENIVMSVPLVTTYEPQNIQDTYAEMGGNVYNDAGSDVAEHGLVISTTSTNPTLNDTKIVTGTGEGEFYGVNSGLQSNTTYHYRAFGTNDNGTGYGEVFTFTTLPSACNPAEENLVNTGTAFIEVENVVKEIFWATYDNGNVQFYTEAQNNNYIITLQFNETSQKMPKTGTYSTKQIFKDTDEASDWKVKVYLSDTGQPNSGYLAPDGEYVFVENNNGTVTFTFCDTYINTQYSLNGKFTYTN